MRDFLRFLFLLLLFLAVIVVGVSLYLVYYARPPIATQEQAAGGEPVEVVFEVAPGETTGDIAIHLAEQGLIRVPLVFQLYARVMGLDSQLEAVTSCVPI